MTNLTDKQQAALDSMFRFINPKVELGTKIGEIIAEFNVGNIPTGTPVNAVNAGETLSISDVVVDGETVVINDVDVYEFLADDEQTKTTESNIAVDITSYVTKSSEDLTVDTQPTSSDTMTVGEGDGEKVYTFVPDGTANAEGEISVGTDLASAQANIVAAINGTDGVNTAHTQVSAGEFAANVSAITAKIGGVIGDSIATTETFTAGTNVFGGATLSGGADCSAANAVTALVSAITAEDTQGVGAADGAGDTVDLTADTAGVIGNSITISETMANASFGAATLENGVDGTVGVEGEVMSDDTYLYRAIAENTTADKNWRRISLGAAY
jgi:hypothetical protein